MRIIIFSIFIVFLTTVLFFLETNTINKNHIASPYHMDNRQLIDEINTLFIDSPEDDLFLYSRLITSMDENGIKSLDEYDFNLLKKNIEKVLESYLNSENLFPESYFDATLLKFKEDEWTNFIRGTLIYIEYLNSIGKQDKANKIFEKNIYYTQQRVLNSKKMINYISVIYNYNTLYKHMKSNHEHKLLKKYPLPDESIFFKKLKLEKEYQLYVYKIRFSLVMKEKYTDSTIKNHTKEIAKYKRQYLDKIKQYLQYYDELAVAIKSESPEKIKVFYKKIEKEKNDFSEKEKNKLKIDYEKYIFLIGFPRNYEYIYNQHKKLINMAERKRN